MKNPVVKQSPNSPEYFWQLTATDVRKIFGLDVNGRLPNEYMRRTYNGPRGAVQLKIVPKSDPLVNQQNNRAHRIFAECPKCHRSIPFGRMQQHVKRADHQEVSK